MPVVYIELSKELLDTQQRSLYAMIQSKSKTFLLATFFRKTKHRTAAWIPSTWTLTGVHSNRFLKLIDSQDWLSLKFILTTNFALLKKDERWTWLASAHEHVPEGERNNCEIQEQFRAWRLPYKTMKLLTFKCAQWDQKFNFSSKGWNFWLLLSQDDTSSTFYGLQTPSDTNIQTSH